MGVCLFRPSDHNYSRKLPMSIAVSALLKPSRIQRFVWGGCGLALCVSAQVIGLFAPGRFLLTPLVAFALAGAGVAVLAAAADRPKTHRIDISGTGDLRVTVQQDVGGRDGGGQPGGGAVLLPGSVIWPMLMVLRYAAPGTGPRVVAVWRDSVDAATWRALAVALAVVGRRGDANEGCEDTTNSLQRTNS
jgi:toxin CptA